MLRKIIKIDEELCNGCGLCAKACHEGAIGMVEGKAKLLRDDYCDGLGDCLPVCPIGAITFEQREAAAYDEAAVKKNMENKITETLPCGCTSTHSKSIDRTEKPERRDCDTQKSETLPCGCPGTHSKPIERVEETEQCNCNTHGSETHLNQWPVQIQLVPPNAPYFENANLLVAADCSAYAYGNFHTEFMKNKITLIGCPKLDDVDYSEKLTAILKMSNIKSVTVVRMEVPCCGGIEQAVKTALQQSGKFIPWQVVTISTDGRILD